MFDERFVLLSACRRNGLNYSEGLGYKPDEVQSLIDDVREALFGKSIDCYLKFIDVYRQKPL